MAAEIFRRMLRDAKGNGITVDSFGTNPYYPDSPEVKGLREGALRMVMGGFDEMARHVPKGIGDVCLEADDKLVLLASKDLPTLEEQLKTVPEQPMLLVWDIEDPFRKPLSKYIESATTLRAEIERNFNLLSGDTE